MVGPEQINKFKLPDPLVHTCQSCNGKLNHKVIGQTILIACPKCAKVYKVENNTIRKEAEFKKPAEHCYIPLGSKGKINDVNYEVVGFLNCKVQDLNYYWREYILFNPMYGYATISESDGHWSFNVETDDFPRNVVGNTISAGDISYSIFNKYVVHIISAAGEFHWDILSKKRPQVTEFVNPPDMLVKEETSDEMNWFKAEYLKPTEVTKIFNLTTKLPKREGVAPHQPFDLNVTLSKFRNFIYASFVLLLLLQLYFVNGARNKSVFQHEYAVIDTAQGVNYNTSYSPEHPFTGSVELKDSYWGSSNLQVDLDAPVDNNWFETSITLINQKTGESFNFDVGLEYYHGSGWSEGSTSEYKVLSEIPDGDYQILIQPFAGTGIGKAESFRVRMTQDVTNWSNFVLLLIALLIVPIVVWIRIQSFENKRWSNSDFAD